MRFILLLIFGSVITFSMSAQECCPYIEEVTIMPETPTVSDDVLVHTVVATPNQGEFLGYDVEIEGFNINVTNCYYQGFATAIQMYTEDVPLGMLPEGEYNLHFVALLTETENDCNAIIDSTVYDTTFTVSGTNSIDPSAFDALNVLNLGDRLVIQNSAEVTDVQITDMSGRIHFSADYSNLSLINANVSRLSSALYIIRIRCSDGSVKSFKFLKS